MVLNILYIMFFKAPELPKPEEPVVQPAKVTTPAPERLPTKGIVC